MAGAAGAATPVRSFDSLYSNLIVGGVVITGVAQGSYINAERAEDDFTEYVGAQGEVAMAETNNRTGEITVTLEQTSPSNDYLYGLSRKKGKAALVDVAVVDANEEGGIQVSAPEARVRRPANYEVSNEITEREWVIFCANMDYDAS